MINCMGILAVEPPAVLCSPVKIVFAVAFVGIWLFLSAKVNNDAGYLKLKREAWAISCLLAGMLGLLAWVTLPSYALGMIIFIALVAGTTCGYAFYRNPHVDPSERIFSAEWFKNFSFASKPLKVENKIHIYTHDGRSVDLTQTQSQDRTIVNQHNLAQELLYDVMHSRAADVVIAPNGKESQIRFVVDGVVTPQPAWEIHETESLIQYIKEKAGLNIIEMKAQQEGKIAVDVAGKQVELEVLTGGGNGGQQMRIRVLEELAITNMDILGMDKRTYSKLTKMFEGPGVIIVSGPPKNGVTSTMYSILKKIDPYLKMLVTVEAKAVREMENITPNQYGNPAVLPKTLASTIRHDPDVIMVDQCPSSRVAELINEFTQEKQVILGMQSTDAISALAKWLNLGGNIRQLRGVVCQNLLRKLCPTCREAYQPDPALLQKMRIPPQNVDVFYRPPTVKTANADMQIETCETCDGVGYVGRTGAFELLEITDEIRQLIASKAKATEIQAAARRNGMRTIGEQALLKVMRGITSIQETVRVSKQIAANNTKSAGNS